MLLSAALRNPSLNIYVGAFMKHSSLFAALFCIPSLLFAAQGNVLLFLDEHFGNSDHSITTPKVDPIVTEFSSAITQEPGIILVSPRVFSEYLGRAKQFHDQAQATVHFASILMGALDGRGFQGKTLRETMNEFPDSNNQLLNAHIYSTYSKLRSNWVAKLSEDENIITLYPTSYLREKRRLNKLITRTELFSHTEEELLLGISLKKSFTIDFPGINDSKMDTLVKDASRWAIHHKTVCRSIEKLFIPQEAYNTEESIPSWVIYLTGHGMHESFWDNALIAGIEKKNFQRLLHDIDKHLRVNCLLYITCYGGGSHTSPIFQEQISNHKTLFDLSYPIIIGSITDATSRSRLVRFIPHEGQLSFRYMADLKKFFSTLHREPKAFEDAMSYIIEINKTDDDRHGISMMPLLRIPRTNTFQPLSFSRAQRRILNDSKTFQLSRALLIAHEMDKTPICIVNKSTIYVNPVHIITPIHIGEYSGTKADRVPAFVSTNEQHQLHVIEKIKTNSTYIAENFHLLFYNFDSIKRRKVFVCKTLEFSQKGFAELMKKLKLPVSEVNNPVIHDVISIQHESRIDIMFCVTIDGHKESFIITPRNATDTSPNARRWNLIKHREYIETFEATARKTEYATRNGEEIEKSDDWIASVWSYFFG